MEAERQAVRTIADEFNVPLRRQGWQIDVLGWEDRGPASGRAQADINADVEICDIFVGILWNRWGTPTGRHTSGFAEEWSMARERYSRTSAPGLWLYFKQIPEVSLGAEDAYDEEVMEFRRNVEAEEIAFYKTFRDAAEFTGLLRVRLLDEILGRSGLTRTDIGGVAIDWSAAYEQEPVWLIPNGRDRQTLAEELLDSRPHDAARVFSELADDVERHGFADHAESLRIRACRALLAANQPRDAVHLLRKVLAAHVWWLRLDEAEHLLANLGDELPPELAGEMRAWRACCRAPSDPAGAAVELKEALEENHPFSPDDETIAQWRVVLGRCLRHERGSTLAPDLAVDLHAPSHDTKLELALLNADAMRAIAHPEADAAWHRLRLHAAERASSDPATAAWIATRVAFDLVAQEELPRAEIAYTDAATRWASVHGGHEQAALAFFSAQAAAQLEGDWNFRGWSWRGIAAIQRSASMTFARRAEELEHKAYHLRLESKHRQAIPLLVAALWCHERAGLVHGVMKDLSLLGDAYAAAEDDGMAVTLYCRIRDRTSAESAAVDASDPAAITARLEGNWPGWSLEARCAVLARTGRWAPPDVAARLVPTVIAALEPSDRPFDNTQTAAADALAALALAIDDHGALTGACRKLVELAREQNYSLGKAGRSGLRALCDVGRISAYDTLIALFAADPRFDDPDPQWVADHLSTPDRIAPVKQAALAGHRRALLALLHADLATSDPTVREYCRDLTSGMLGSDLGMTPDGTGMWGLMALNAEGLIAAATGDEALQTAAADKLLVFALESRWPMINRVSAVGGLWPLVGNLNSMEWLEALRPLASPETDLDEEAAMPGRQMWARRGDLQAVTLKVCAALTQVDGAPDWLAEALSEAAFDERGPVREAAWYGAGLRDEWFNKTGVRHALVDSDANVRSAALHAWRQRSKTALPTESLGRLAGDRAIGVRLALVTLLKTQPDEHVISALRSDRDGYVRGIARRELAQPT